jgi:hypothetical protein
MWYIVKKNGMMSTSEDLPSGEILLLLEEMEQEKKLFLNTENGFLINLIFLNLYRNLKERPSDVGVRHQHVTGMC